MTWIEKVLFFVLAVHGVAVGAWLLLLRREVLEGKKKKSD
jgi:hypothetical protein